jgi:hypothetical protein
MTTASKSTTISVEVLSETAGNPSILSSPQSRNRRNHPRRSDRTRSESRAAADCMARLYSPTAASDIHVMLALYSGFGQIVVAKKIFI